jgi:hypothetical protein
LYLVGDLFELNVKLRCQKVKHTESLDIICNVITAELHVAAVLLQLVTGTVAVCSVLQSLRQTSVDWRMAEHNSVMFCLDAE